MLLNIILLIIAFVLAVLLIAAYVITPIISWLVTNPIWGVVLLVVIGILVSVVFVRETREDKQD
jgi:hypothetical protein